MQEMESWNDGWNPMMDDFNNQDFNTYGVAASQRDCDSVVQLFVGGIPACLTEQGLRNLMSPIASIRYVAVIAHKNIAFVTVLQKDALKLITHFDNYDLGGNYLYVRLSKSKRKTEIEQTAAACGTTDEGEQKKTSFSSSSRLTVELTIPALAYPTFAKYARIGDELIVKVLSVASPSQFWICHDSHDDDSRMTEMYDKMQEHYSRLPTRTSFRPNGSGLYAVLERDSGKWCRAQALDFDTKSVSVLYLDYGTHDRVSLTKLHSLEGLFLSLPFRAVCCSLSHIQRPPQWSEEATSCMCQLLSNVQPVRARVCDIYQYNLSVELILPSGQTVNDALVSRKYANYVDGFEPSSVQAGAQQSMAESAAGLDLAELSEDTAVSYTTTKDMNFMPLSVGEQYDAVVLHVRDAGDVTICQEDRIGELRTLFVELSRYQVSGCYFPRIGEIVAAQYAADSSWNRAEVLSLDDDSATVRFIDYGNTAKVNIKSTVQLQPRHIAFPVYSVKVMFRSSNVHNKLPAEYDTVKVKVVEQHGTRYVVSLLEDDTALHLANDPAIQRAYSVSDIKWCGLNTGKTYKVWVTDSTDVCNFYAQLSDVYEPIDDALQAIYSNRSGGYEPQQVGELIALHLETDDAWYRAVVKEISMKAVKCQLIDFGINVTTASKNISQFDCKLLAHPVAAFKCAFYDASISSANVWKDDFLKPLTAVYDMTVAEVKNDVHFVELVDIESSTDMKQKLIDEGVLVKASSSGLQYPATGDKSSSVSTPGDSQYSAGRKQQEDKLSCHIVQSKSVLDSLSDAEVGRICLSREKIRIVHANNPGSFYIQSSSDSVQKKLEGLHQSITDFCRQSSCKSDAVGVGQSVGVMHDDGIWYRGEVVDSSSGKFQVQFVDYGIIMTASSAELCPLPDSLATSLPRQAIHCGIDRIAGCEPDGSWSLTAAQCFRNMSENCDFILKSIYKSDSGSSWLVDLLHTAIGRTAKELLLDHQLAVPKTNVSLTSGKSVSPVKPDAERAQDRSRSSAPLLSSAVKTAVIQANDAVTVTCVHSPSSFFIQQHRGNVEVLQEDLSRHYKAHSQQYCPKKVGELVTVMHNSCWYRAEVLSFDAVSASVFLIDRGNTVDNIDVRNIRILPLQFATALPKLAVHCALGGTSGTCQDGSFSEAATMWLRDNYLQVSCTVTKVNRIESSDVSLVNLKKMNAEKTVRQLLLANAMAVVSTGPVLDSASNRLASSSQAHVQAQLDRPAGTQQPCSKPTPAVSIQRIRFEDAVALQVGAVVSVVHVISPADFYVMPSDAAALQKMMSLSLKIDEHCHTSDSAGYRPQYVGEPVAGRFEGQWYRAEVVKLMSGDCCEVFFVDFGNTAVVDAGDLCSLLEEFVKWPKQAVRCGVDRVCGTGAGQRFTHAASEWFQQKFACGLNATLLSVHIVDGGKHMINMSVNGDRAGAAELLVAAEFARYSDL